MNLKEWTISYIDSLRKSQITETLKITRQSNDYVTGPDFTVYEVDGLPQFSIKVNSSAGWSTDPHDKRGRELRLMDRGNRKATLYWKEGNLKALAKQMHDLTSETTWGEDRGLTPDDYYKVLKMWVDMGLHESTNKPNLVEKLNSLLEKNVPTNPSKWSYYQSQAKKKFDVYPSAYANAWAAKKYKDAGGGWKKESVNEAYSYPYPTYRFKGSTSKMHDIQKEFAKNGIEYSLDLSNRESTVKGDDKKIAKIVKSHGGTLVEKVNEASEIAPIMVPNSDKWVIRKIRKLNLNRPSELIISVSKPQNTFIIYTTDTSDFNIVLNLLDKNGVGYDILGDVKRVNEARTEWYEIDEWKERLEKAISKSNLNPKEKRYLKLRAYKIRSKHDAVDILNDLDDMESKNESVNEVSWAEMEKIDAIQKQIKKHIQVNHKDSIDYKKDRWMKSYSDLVGHSGKGLNKKNLKNIAKLAKQKNDKKLMKLLSDLSNI